MPWAAQAGEPRVIIYPLAELNTQAQAFYPVRLLEEALARSGAHYRARASGVSMLQGRALRQLEEAQGIDVMWSMTSVAREAKLLPIRIPIYKGLISWRLFLIHESQAVRFNQIKDLASLKQRVAGQVHDWPDKQILQANGFSVYGSSTYGSLFRMLAQKRIDYFPRSLIEIWDEAAQHQAAGLMVEPSFLIRYPSASYFFVRRGDHALAEALSQGLEMMIQDGSFDRLFMEFHGNLIKKAAIEDLVIFDLDNPTLPPKTPLNRKELWFRE
ncbi:substrate-binding periplasmic protein [Paremcibacter congregatus]|nr:transporter substrate-binding domain-containing protein [Paremcibacter congregatus]